MYGQTFMYITVIYEKCGEGAFIRGGMFIRDNTVLGLYSTVFHLLLCSYPNKHFTARYCQGTTNKETNTAFRTLYTFQNCY